jgi:hypothetical protein
MNITIENFLENVLFDDRWLLAMMFDESKRSYSFN